MISGEMIVKPMGVSARDRTLGNTQVRGHDTDDKSAKTERAVRYVGGKVREGNAMKTQIENSGEADGQQC